MYKFTRNVHVQVALDILRIWLSFSIARTSNPNLVFADLALLPTFCTKLKVGDSPSGTI
jgi:hypothetical protein